MILKNKLGKSSDTIFREFDIGLSIKTKAFICFIDGLADKNKIDQHIVKALMVDAAAISEKEDSSQNNLLQLAKNSLISTSEIKEASSFDDVFYGILSGDVVLFIHGYTTPLIISLKSWEHRAVSVPETELVVRGPREGFTETLRVNTSMLRRKIKSPNLVLESLTLGKQTHTDICLAYIDGIANPAIVAEVHQRLSRVDVDSILESGYIEQFIEDNPLSPMSTIGNTEKADVVAAKLLEGRIAIFCDGTPFVLTIPYLFIEALQSAEDYYSRPYFVTIVRLLRYSSLIITVLAPALYVALETFHQELVPTVLLITAAATREGIPFPAFLETLLMGFIFEILREAGVRMPRLVGQAVSIVGALVLGQAAVQAGIISAPMVIITGITSITSFIITPLLDSAVLFRLFLLILAGNFGLYGITIGVIFILGHMCSLRSFGTPYLSPFAPTAFAELKDSFMRAPWWMMHTRPKSITWNESKRQAVSMPSPDQGKKEDNID
ncbi:spore germination protein [Anaerosinus massiliensis]|uniref:spore germination protein n=1 Tax=Massilibacillus massiliensis TaxID=1806837 RepID=UPI0018FEC669|nr:spore germination protein [Massilibacillus massiliensis]